jgi:hypothetical protein
MGAQRLPFSAATVKPEYIKDSGLKLAESLAFRQ